MSLPCWGNQARSLLVLLPRPCSPPPCFSALPSPMSLFQCSSSDWVQSHRLFFCFVLFSKKVISSMCQDYFELCISPSRRLQLLMGLWSLGRKPTWSAFKDKAMRIALWESHLHPGCRSPRCSLLRSTVKQHEKPSCSQRCGRGPLTHLPARCRQCLPFPLLCKVAAVPRGLSLYMATTATRKAAENQGPHRVTHPQILSQLTAVCSSWTS